MLPLVEMAHSSNVMINGGTFNLNSAQGDFHVHNRDPESGLHILSRVVSLGAIHDSAERYPSPNCHPDTRKAVRQIILDWIENESLESSFFWLYGPAGAGKTAILQAIAEFLCSPSGCDRNLGGSFSFSRGRHGRDQGHFLFSTIAYQLALKVPGLRQHVNRIVELDPTLHTKSMDVQLQALIIDAFRNLSPLPQRSHLVIIDGLDECHDKMAQQLILRLLCETVTVHKLPLRFIVGSRPESHIRASFDQKSLYTITNRVVLDETFNPGKDIHVFLRDGFAKTCAENSILAHVEQPWPREGVIDLLVQGSSGQFIYAATVLKFVGADFCSPTKQLALVLKPDSTAFSDLDQLYTQILSVYPSAVNIVQVLGIIIACERGNNLPEVIEDILGMEKGELKLVLRGLSSLMNEDGKLDEDRELYDDGELYEDGELDDDGELNDDRESDEDRDEDGEFLEYVIPPFAHASFRDYLFDSSRSGSFHVNQQDYENQVTIRSFSLILQSIRFWRRSSITRALHATTWDYFSSYLADHFIRSSKVVKESIMTDIHDLVQEFWITSTDGANGEPIFAMRRLHETLRRFLEMLSNPNSWHDSSCAQSDLDDRPGVKFKILLDGCRKMLDQSLSKSKDLGDILRLLPGVVVQRAISIEAMADLYRIQPDLLDRLIKSPIEPLKTTNFSQEYRLDEYLYSFLLDRDRSQLNYCDPILQHISICRQFLSLLDLSRDASFRDYREIYGSGLSNYAHKFLYHHLCAATDFFNAQNIFDDHPVVEILRDLEATEYYLDENLLGRKLSLAQRTFLAILRWADMLNCRLKSVAVSVSNVDLMGRVCYLLNKMYREMLCITTNERTYITLGPARLDHVEVRTFSWPPQYKIVLSWELLSWILVEGRIPSSFTNFITTPELSGPLYISSDIYHAQITEYLLDIPDRSVWKHLSRALPTEMIFYRLRTIPSDHLFRGYSTELKLNTLEIIIKWLQGLGSERPSDLHDRFQGELLRYKVEL